MTERPRALMALLWIFWDNVAHRWREYRDRDLLLAEQMRKLGGRG